MPFDPSLPLALAGGLLIGAAALLLLGFSGRIAGISGLVGGLVVPRAGDLGWRAAFLLGLLGGGLVLRVLSPGTLPQDLATSRPVLVAAGLLVGFGTRLGNGCTSGHGVCGLGRRSRRSLAATLTFLLGAFATVFVVRHVIGAVP